MNVERILIDTSVWIEYFRDAAFSFQSQMDKIMESDEVYVPRIVLAELLQGAKSDKELSVIEDFLDAFHIIDQTEDTWIKAGRLSFKLKKQGKSIHLVDCYIAVIAQEHGCKIFTLNRHFDEIQKELNISLVKL